MGRRGSYNNVPRSWSNDERSSIGDSHVSDAITNLSRIQQRAAAMMASYDHTREHTLPMLFDDENLEKLRQVRGMVKTSGDHRTYNIAKDVTLTIDFEGARVPAIEPTIFKPNPARIEPLLTFTAAVRAVHLQYEEVKGVLRWLNRNATPGAIRYYFPQAMKLCPKSPIWRDLQEVPSRYTTPPDYSAWIQAIRDAANTVAAMMLMPEDVGARSRNTMWLTFTQTGVSLDPTDPNKKHYSTDQITYNL